MRLSRNALLLVFALITPAFAADAPIPEGITQAEPYTTDKEDQLQCIGGTKQPRFKVTEISWPANAGEAEICLWKDDKYSVVTLTVDDNCKPDHNWWLEQAEKHGLKVTWFVITNGVGKNKGFSGVWADWQKLYDAGHAIQSHTVNHHGDDSKQTEDVVRKEYGGSKAIIEKELPGNKVLTVAYPCGKGQYNIAKEYFIAGRGVVGTPNPANKIDYANTNSSSIHPDQINAVLGRKAEQIKWLNNPSYKRGWLSAHFHLVAHGGSEEQKQASIAKTEKMIENLAANKDRFWMATFVDAAKYGQERDTAELKVTGTDKIRITFTLTDKMKDDLFDLPLTVKIRLDDSWKTVKATQDGKEIKADFIEHEGKPYGLIHAVPDKGEVTITP